MKISGIGFVYMITSPSNRIYIGSTSDFDNRWRNYKSCSCKDQPKLYNSFIKHGVNNHIFEVIWAGDINDMLYYEAITGNWYDVLHSKIGLNCKLPKINDIYKSISQDTINKISAIHKLAFLNGTRINPMLNKNHSYESKLKIGLIHKDKKQSNFRILNRSLLNSKKVYQYNNNLLIKEWSSVKLAGDTLNIQRSDISKCCNNIVKSAGGFKWSYIKL